MISIGLIERLLRAQNDHIIVTYFFCQNADYELNTLESIIKGLILQLVNQQDGLKASLRRRWDPVKNHFEPDIISWRMLWDVFMEMLDRCECQRVYIIVDALDECQDDGMADFLKLIVRTGLQHPSKIKWLLTSRPIDSVDRELLAGNDEAQVSLELNLQHISGAVKKYITFKVAELHRRHKYQEVLRQKIESELNDRAEGTYLWVSLVCKRLESVHRDEALATIQKLPPGLHFFYQRIYTQLCGGELDDMKRRMRLLKVMMLAYRPLYVKEVESLTGLTDQGVAIEALVNQCASFINLRGNVIEFVHQSAREYLAGIDGQSILDSHEHYTHDEIALSCLSYLSERLKLNLFELPRPDSTRGSMEELNREKGSALLASLNYAASFWAQHFAGGRQTAVVQNALVERNATEFLRTKMLEWLECLSLLGKPQQAIEGLKAIEKTADVSSICI
jgi:hypothetical protein